MNLLDLFAIDDIRGMVAESVAVAAPFMYTCKWAFQAEYPRVRRIRDTSTLIFLTDSGEIAVNLGECRYNAELGAIDPEYRPGLYSLSRRLYRYPSDCEESAAIYSLFDSIIRVFTLPLPADAARCYYTGRDTLTQAWRPSAMFSAIGHRSDTHHKVRIRMCTRIPRGGDRLSKLPSVEIGAFYPAVNAPCIISLVSGERCVIGVGDKLIAVGTRLVACAAEFSTLVALWPDCPICVRCPKILKRTCVIRHGTRFNIHCYPYPRSLLP